MEVDKKIEELIELLIQYQRHVDCEYSIIYKILGYLKLPTLEEQTFVTQFRNIIEKRIEQTKELEKRNDELIDFLNLSLSVLQCASSPIGNSLRVSLKDRVDEYEKVTMPAEKLVQERDENRAVLNSLEGIDEDVLSTIEDSEASIETQPVIVSVKRKQEQTQDIHRKGEARITLSDGECPDLSEEYEAADLRDDSEDLWDDEFEAFWDNELEADDKEEPAGMPAGKNKVANEPSPVTLDKVQFSAVAPKTFVKGEYSLIQIFMYEQAFRDVVDQAIADADEPVKETKSGILKAERESKITVQLSSPDLEIEDDTETQIWHGDYLNFTFAVELPDQYKKKQILFIAAVYINDIIATRLKFVAKCKSQIEQKLEISRNDVLSGFVSYASQDRNRVALVVEGMKKARPDMDIFFDIDSLRSGDNWEQILWQEIDERDVLFLCWSKYARNSKWVDAEWRYALQNKGADSIEPVPIESPDKCPPPKELNSKHFNDKLVYIINAIMEETDHNSDDFLSEW